MTGRRAQDAEESSADVTRSTGSTRRTLVVAVVTYRRCAELARLLPELRRQVRDCTDSAWHLRGSVLIVDNDPEGSAATVVGDPPCADVTYVAELEPGIAAARNRALTSADAADLLVFIDDDEWPEPDWLQRLLATYEETRPVGVVGPVISDYAQDPDAWLVAGRFFDRRRLPTGTSVAVAATNNLLLDLHQLRQLGISFDATYGLSGGSDTLFTRLITSRGGRLVWCDEAVVLDKVPPSRLTRRWVLQRAFRSGNSWSRTSLAITSGSPRRAFIRVHLAVVGGSRVLAGVTRYAIGLLGRSSVHQARGLRTAARGGGMLLGLAGGAYVEYGRPSSGTPSAAAE